VSSNQHRAAHDDGSVTEVEVAHLPTLAAEAQRRLNVDGLAVCVRAGPSIVQLLHATDATAADLDELQFTLGEGPCIDSFSQRRRVLAPDLADARSRRRWPMFSNEAVQTGVSAYFAFPLAVGAVPFGTVGMYRRYPAKFVANDVPGQVDEIGRAVLDDLTRRTSSSSSTGLGDPRFGDNHVAQATGMVSVQLGVSVAQASAQLRAAAFAAHRSVSDLADDVVARRLAFSPDADDPLVEPPFDQ